MLDLGSKPLRDIETVNKGVGPPTQALRVLEDATMWFSLGKPHIWQQRLESDPELMHKALKVAWEARGISAEIVDLLRWTERTCREDSSEATLSLVVHLWVAAVQESISFREKTVVRWPEELAIDALPDPPLYQRASCPPEACEPWYPSIRCLVSAAETGFSQVIDLTIWSLWKGGATEEILQNFISDARSSDAKRIAQVAGRYLDISFEGSQDARSAFLKKIAQDNMPWRSLLVIQAGGIESYHKAAQGDHMTCKATVEGRLSSALRMDPDIIFLPTVAAKREDVETAVSIFSSVDCVLVVEADYPFLSELKAAIAPLNVPLLVC